MASRTTSTVLAIVATVVAFYVAQAAGADPQVFREFGNIDAGTDEMTILNVLGFTAVPGLLALLLAAGLDRVTSKAKEVWTIVALLALLVSVFFILQLDLNTTTTVWQVILNLVFSLLLIGGFWISWPETDSG